MVSAVTPDAHRRSAQEADLPASTLCARCSRHHPAGRPCFPRVRWVAALGEDLAEAATSLRGALDALRGDRDGPWPRGRWAAAGGILALLAAVLRATGIL